MSKSFTIKGRFEGDIQVDSHEAYNLLAEVDEAKKKLGSELPDDHEWYGIDSLGKAASYIARQSWIDEPDQWDISLTEVSNVLI